MAVIVDSFTEASTDTALPSHTPDTGTSWTVAFSTATTAVLQAKQATDVCQASANETGVGVTYTASPAPAGAEYDVEITIVNVDTSTSNRPWWLFGRYVDSSNYYGVGVRPTGLTDIDLRLRVGGVNSSLGTYNGGLSAGDVIKLEIRDATKRVYINGVQQISSADNSITSVGLAGLGIGRDPGNSFAGGNINTSWTLDDYTVTDAPAGPTDLPPGGVILVPAAVARASRW